MTLREAIRRAAGQLSAVSDTARLDAELLAAHCLGVSREALLLGHLEDAEPPHFADYIDRRLDHEPVAYITGRVDFWSLSLQIGPSVLIPRGDSETLIEAALAACAATPPTEILDLGTGSGALLLAALSEWPAAQGLGVDQSADALAIARKNALATGLSDRARFCQGDWGAGLTGPFNLILCNPPYIATGFPLDRQVAAFEPASALYAGEQGLDDYRRIAPQIAQLLDRKGVACVEIGFDQAASVGALFAEQGLSVDLRRDLGGRDRCLVLTSAG